MARTIERPDLALVVGGAKCVWDDLKALEEIVGGAWPGWIVAANDIATHDPQKLHPELEWDGTIDAWASLHPRNFRTKKWIEQRESAGLSMDFETWAHGYKALVDRVLKRRSAGSSGLFSVWVALEPLAAEKVVVAGVPQTSTPHFDESRVHTKDDPWTRAKAHWPRWQEKEPELRGRVCSMSGNTKKLLGAPTATWLGIGP